MTVLVLLAGACGSGSDAAPSPDSTPVATSTATTSAAPTTTTATTTNTTTIGETPDTSEPVTLRLGTEEHDDSVAALMVEAFADEVERASNGTVQIEVTYGAADGGVAWDQKVIRQASEGKFDLVVARAGAWHSSGVTTLDVLQLPELVDTDDQADRLVADAPTVDRLLGGLDAFGFTGLGLYPEAPRYLMLLDDSVDFAPESMRGRVIRAPLSETVFELLTAGGMSPIDLTAADFTVQVPEGSVTATEGHLARVGVTTTVDGNSDAVVATNLPLYTKFLVLAARTDAIDPEVLTMLGDAATSVVDSFIGARSREADSVQDACAAGGRLVEMADVDREAFLTAVQPVVQAFADGPDGDLLEAVRSAAGPADRTDWLCPNSGESGPAPTGSASTVSGTSVAVGDVGLVLPTKRSDIVPTTGDLPDGVYRFSETVEALDLAEPDTQHTAADEFIGEFTLVGGTAELRYFNMDGSPMAGEPPSTGGLYQVDGDVMVFATPPNRAMPGTSGIYLLRWSLDGDVLTLTQIDDGRVDADFAVPWIRVGNVP